MKSKKLKKLDKLFHEEVRNHEKELRPLKMSEEVSGGDWSEYDPEVSDKFKKMVLNLSTYKNNINISNSLVSKNNSNMAINTMA